MPLTPSLKLKIFLLNRKIKSEKPFWQKLFNLENLVEQRHKKAQRLIQNTSHSLIFETLNSFRIDLQAFLNGLKKRTGQHREKYFKALNFQKVLKAFPIWVVNTGDINRVLPLEAELF